MDEDTLALSLILDPSGPPQWLDFHLVIFTDRLQRRIDLPGRR